MSPEGRGGLTGHERTTSDGMYEQVMRPATSEYFEDIWRGCDTALLGRWLCSVEKGVVSATLPEQAGTFWCSTARR